MKKLIAVLSVALVFVFSCVLTSFADDSVVSGYAVDNVPYSSSFDGVLTSSDNGSQLYSSSQNKTYNTSAILSVTSDSDSLYYYPSIYSGLFTVNPEWPSAYNMSYKNLGTSVQFNLVDTNLNGKFYSRFNNNLTKIKAGRKYRFSFTIVVNANLAKGDVTFKLRNSLDSSDVFTLFSISAPVGSGGGIGANTAVTVDVVIPDSVINGVYPYLVGNVLKGYNHPVTVAINDFTVTDVTTEDLDKSLDKLGNKIDKSINPDVPYNKWDNGSFKDSAGKLKDAEKNLPTVDFNAIEELKNSIDISSYSHAFAAINQLFIRLVDTVGVTPLIFFACFFGFCIFLIGRKLSGG